MAIHIVVQQRLTQHCKAIIFQLKKIKGSVIKVKKKKEKRSCFMEESEEVS